jgi:tetratricopeptide (TPR) repeat protein
MFSLFFKKKMFFPKTDIEKAKELEDKGDYQGAIKLYLEQAKITTPEKRIFLLERAAICAKHAKDWQRANKLWLQLADESCKCHKDKQVPYYIMEAANSAKSAYRSTEAKQLYTKAKNLFIAIAEDFATNKEYLNAAYALEDAAKCAAHLDRALEVKKFRERAQHYFMINWTTKMKQTAGIQKEIKSKTEKETLMKIIKENAQSINEIRNEIKTLKSMVDNIVGLISNLSKMKEYQTVCTACGWLNTIYKLKTISKTELHQLYLLKNYHEISPEKVPGISKFIESNWVEKKGGKFVLTPQGRLVIELLDISPKFSSV